MPETEREPPFTAYEGAAPFIFVSYSHRDAASIFPELKELHGRGFRIWYDDGIEAGKVWPEKIATALGKSSLFVVFISPNSVASRHVRNEIHLALELEKPCLAIHLCRTELPPGLRLDLGSIQAILKYALSPEHYRRKLENALPEELRSATAAPVKLNPVVQPPAAEIVSPLPPAGAGVPRLRGRGIPLALAAVLAFVLLAIILPWRASSPGKPGVTSGGTGEIQAGVDDQLFTIQSTATPSREPDYGEERIAVAPALQPELFVEPEHSAEPTATAAGPGVAMPPAVPAARPPQKAATRAKVAQVEASDDVVAAPPRAARDRSKIDEPLSDHCQSLLKSYQLGDADSIESYRRDCVR